MKPLLGPILVLTLAASPLAAQAAPHRGPRAERIARALGLTEAQRASIHAILGRHRPDLLLRRDAVRQSQLAFHTALRDGSQPEAKLRSLHGQASAARLEWLLARRSVRQEVRAVLTPEQRERAAELRGLARARTRQRLLRAERLTG